MRRDAIRPLPCKGTLAETILALADAEQGGGARSTAELAAWCRELARDVSEERRTVTCELSVRDIEPMSSFLSALADALRKSPGGARSYENTDDIVEQVRTLSRVAFSALFPEHPELDDIGRQIAEREAQLVDLLALELEVVTAYKAAGVLPADAPPPSTAELVARMRAGRTGT